MPGQVIYQQQRQKNPLGQAISGAAATYGDSMVKGAEIKRQKDQQIAEMVLKMLPNLASNPEMLSRFTSHPDFQMIYGALQRSGMGSVFSRDAQTGTYNLNVPAEKMTLDDMIARDVQQGNMKGAQEKATVKASMSGYGALAKAIQTADIKDAYADPSKPSDLAAEDKLVNAESQTLMDADYNTVPKGVKTPWMDKMSDYPGYVKARAKRNVSTRRQTASSGRSEKITALKKALAAITGASSTEE